MMNQLRGPYKATTAAAGVPSPTMDGRCRAGRSGPGGRGPDAAQPGGGQVCEVSPEFLPRVEHHRHVRAAAGGTGTRSAWTGKPAGILTDLRRWHG